MCIHPHYPVTWIRRVRLPFATLYGSAGRFKSYLPDLLSRELSQPARLPLWWRIIAYSSFSLPFRKLYHKRRIAHVSRLLRLPDHDLWQKGGEFTPPAILSFDSARCHASHHIFFQEYKYQRYSDDGDSSCSHYFPPDNGEFSL